MENLRYTASARLGVWDSIPSERDKFLASLADILRDNSHGVLEFVQIKSVPTDDSLLASRTITAICDKIITRGNPTLVDLDFEQSLLNGPCQRFLRVDELAEDKAAVGFRLSDFKNPDTTTDKLLDAVQDLLCLPFRSQTEGETTTDRTLPPEIQRFDSKEEELFFNQFATAFGKRFCAQLHPQIPFCDLVENPSDDIDGKFKDSRVDFVLQAGPVKWVFEVDGSQHKEQGQRNLDKQRDARLKKNGWTVHRITAQAVRKDFARWIKPLKSLPGAHRIFDAVNYDSVQTVIAKSEIHAAAYYSILIPLAMHRCLRGLLLLYFYGILDPARQQRILLIEEDLPVAVEAFRILRAIWTRIHVLAPDTPPAPSLERDVIGIDSSLRPGQTEATRYLDAPDGSYDMILSHSFLLDTGYSGNIEKSHFPDHPENFVRLRHAIGFRTERSLQGCKPLYYDLADVERSITSQNGDEPEPMPQEKHEALLFFLKHIFRKRDFRDGQLLVVARLLQGKASIVLLPTGGGKSLTYQLSGLLLPGMTIIIDPLVSLMTDQVANLKAASIDLVGSISSQFKPEEKEAVLKDMGARRLAFIFISPERLQNQVFRERLKAVVAKFPISLAVIDEAHCVSEWGHDFRPSYLHMPRNLQCYCSVSDGRKPTLVGLTGTASFAVLNDIQTEMQITDEDAIILSRSFDRKELRFEVRKVPKMAKPVELKKLKTQIPGILDSKPKHFYELRGDRTNSGLVFCPHVDGLLGIISVANKLGHEHFFAGRKPKHFDDNKSQWDSYKNQGQQNFKENRIQELVATKAFGMGIDKPNIRYTIHYAAPQSIEAFYQEAGRAGRDGEAACCLILYSDDNWDLASDILNETDHEAALDRLEGINRNVSGDFLVQLWLMLQSYRGRSVDKKDILDFWNQIRAPKIDGMKTGDTKKPIIKRRFPEDKNGKQQNDKRKTYYERVIFRLMLLGVVEDYTIDWQLGCFAIQVRCVSPVEVKDHLRRYLRQYKGQDFAGKKVSNIPENTVENALRAATDVLIDFIYDEIVDKRKHALRTMGEICREFTTDQNFRQAIVNYLQKSEFSEELKGWVNRSFDEIGLDKIHKLLEKDTTLDEAAKRRLVGTVRRMLDEDPQNVALRYLSLCARARSEAESDSSVLQEATTLASQVNRYRKEIREPDHILLSALHEIAVRRPNLLNDIGNDIFHRTGTVALARLILRSDLANHEVLYGHSVDLIKAGVLRTLTECVVYTTLLYFSLCARARSEAEHGDRVLQEVRALARQVNRHRKEIREPDEILLSALHEIAVHRLKLLNDVWNDIFWNNIFKQAGTATLARLILRSDLANHEVLYGHSVDLIKAGVLRTLTECTFYNTTHKRS